MMIRTSITLDEVIDYLNELIETDKVAMAALVACRVPCNQSMAEHPTVQVWATSDGYVVGLLGILNGLFGISEDGWGTVTAVYDGEGNLLRFVVTDGKGAEAVIAGRKLPKSW